MTTGSLAASDAERKWYAARSRWWNSTGGGSSTKPVKGNNATVRGVGAVKAGDGGLKFRAEWEELDAENWAWMEKNNVDPSTGKLIPKEGSPPCSPEAAALVRGPRGSAVGDANRAARVFGDGWFGRHKVVVGFAAVIMFVLVNRALSGREL